MDQFNALVQYGTGLYMVDVKRVAREFFYQRCLSDFANFGFLILEPSMGINELLQIEVDARNDTGADVQVREAQCDFFLYPLPQGDVLYAPCPLDLLH